jgi:glycine/D-amino acid oxidase-like deaminating enzyme
VLAIRPGGAGRRPEAVTAHGTVRADVVVRAVEAWTPTLPGERRTLAPVYSLMIATEPLGDEVLGAVGGSSGVTFTDGRHLLVYGQRTADGRFAFGGRGAPYHFASRISPDFDRLASVHDALERTLVELFPAVRKAAVTHRWGGCLGVHRDWHPSVRFDRRSGLGIAGGYAGDGVSTTNLAGRTLADLVLGEDSDLTTLCWVGHRSPRWEPEPLRFAGVNAGLIAMSAADRAEQRSGRPSRLASAFGRLTGG